MSPFARFVEELLYEGAIRLLPEVSFERVADAVPVLERAFQNFRQDVAGPLIDFDAKTALAAAALIHQASWQLLTGMNVDNPTPLPRQPHTVAQHLSADMLLRFAPQLLRRARGLSSALHVANSLEATLRHWPLSGVLADIADPPLTKLDFAAHPGLLLWYAERLAAHEKPAWMPVETPGLEFVDLVWKELGKKFDSRNATP